MILVVLLILIAAGAFAYGISRMFSEESGWQKIEAETSADSADCSDDFSFMYYLGDSGAAAAAQAKAVRTVYTQSCQYAYQLFHIRESFEQVTNICDINANPNEPLVVDEYLYSVFETIAEHQSRYIYLGPAMVIYDDIFSCTEDYQLADFDPALNPEMAEYYQTVAAYAADPEMVDVRLLGDNTIMLYVAEEYETFIRENGAADYIDFSWMKNAFIADYIAEQLTQEGYTRGYLSSYDGFTRNLDQTDTLYTLEGCSGTDPVEYEGPMSIVSYRNYPVDSADRRHYYVTEAGEIKTPYMDVEDGLCRNALDEFCVYAGGYSCAELLLKTAPVYIADTFDPQELEKMKSAGISAIYAVDEK